MGLLDESANSIVSSNSFKGSSLFNRDVSQPPEPDFKGGFQIVEIQDGRVLSSETVRLVGNLMPFQPFEHGGEQKIVKEYYPGNSEPSVQVLGPREDDIVFNGRLKDKKYKDPAARGVSWELQQQLNAIRIRGNLVEITMGEFRRFGFLERVKFGIKTKSDIDYQLSFSIIGFNRPLRCQQIKTQREVPFEINKNLIARLGEFQESANSIPETMPQSIGDVIRNGIADVSEAINTVTSFIDDILGTIDDVGDAINRGQGVIRFAKNQVLGYKNRIGGISFTDGRFVGGTQAGLNGNRAFLASSVSDTFDFMAFLEELRSRLAELIATTPIARVRIQRGDTLQNIASKFYNNPQEWEKIYDHNELTSTDLVRGDILEIPRL